MKKIAALVTTLILGASSAALAAPGWADNSQGPANDRFGDRMGDRGNDRGNDRAFARPAFRPTIPTWTMLESSGSLARGRDFINVSTSARFSKLKLEATGRGSLYIEKLVIVFGNGQKQTVAVNKKLSARSGATMIDVDGRSRQIDKVMVLGRGGYRASYSLAALASL